MSQVPHKFNTPPPQATQRERERERGILILCGITKKDVRNTIIQLDSTTFYSMTRSNSQNIFEPQRQFDSQS